jgi:hypothetical protein
LHFKLRFFIHYSTIDRFFQEFKGINLIIKNRFYLILRYFV